MLNPNPAPPSSPILGVGDHRTDIDEALNPKKPPQMPSTAQLWYDGIMMVLIIADLLLMGLDSLMMSNFGLSVTQWLGISEWVIGYRENWHHHLTTAGGFFTIFLVVELLVRWALAIVNKRYYRWFFFPFVHWYEVLGCSPQLRALRLLRVGVIGYRLYQLGKLKIPKSWIKTGKFYYSIVLEEISDRVIITALDNIRMELANGDAQLVQSIIDKHRPEIQTLVVDILNKEVTPILVGTPNNPPAFTPALASQVGTAIQQSLSETPELRRIIRMIPIAGGLIENQMLSIGQHIGENLVTTLSKNLTHRDTLTPIYQQIGKSIANIDTTSPVLETLVREIIHDSLDAFEKQVRVQQWKHNDMVKSL